MKRLTVDKISSSTKNISIAKDIRIQPEVIAKEGYIIAGRVLGTKTVYNKLEDRNGRLVSLHEGDIIVGVLGHRDALRGYTGYVPDKISIGDKLQLLNLGGVIGKCTSNNPEVGKPYDIEILGSVLVFPEFQSRIGVPAHISMNAVKPQNLLSSTNTPVIFVAGTCMQAGKTYAATQIIRHFSSQGLKVGGVKLTGVSLLRDTLDMIDHGASHALSFMDSGIVTTNPQTATPTAKGLLSELTSKGVDVIVAELGDGILGQYGVQSILKDQELMSTNAALVLCASDPVAAWGGIKILEQQYNLNVDVVSGAATDNKVGTEYIENEFSIAAINARTNPQKLGNYISEKVQITEPMHKVVAINARAN